ncbi:guanitoxin biosynthesis heme-dependent pre-guanitoxin N-hydroxylase GntA [Mesonia mobilis]|uniref:guanitoxin biosynthesis heme-dependent pre-guanitoxin N-hydroxylase GntA n=1 Tax=Mesonia mobilis TaxID=369791 RepID=UPI0026F2AAF7|nr:guanitoxin biosynthesis heme-dependent pre-guanitoxin N-hydroxylase GntA [Mesonia mobilis]
MKTERLKKDFEHFILQKNHPCVMAQSVFNLESVVLNDYERMIDINKSYQLLNDLEAYLKNYNFESKEFQSFIAVFSKEQIPSEEQFEKLLWQQLQMLSELDTKPWDTSVNADPDHENFSFSLLGKSFYMVGMHPESSRFARQSPYPALVFNLHAQFEMLRDMGTYQHVKKRIRKRDEALQGFINPMLEDFGAQSEARQYSGREVKKNWKCPFHH